MGRVGFLSILTGMFMLIGSWLYYMLVKFELPLYYRIAIMLIVAGVIIIIIKQLFDRAKEVKENDSYKDL
ncbi:MAG: hypothetical protein JXR88_11250 [Clostridia bacterium]|nr:hypothetical protein [Clostridia bacterium]